MAVENLKDKLSKIVSKEPSKWLEQAKWRLENRAWLKNSQAIAIRILSRIEEMNISQKELAEKMGLSPQMVNKLVKGSENLTLETISKLESALDIKLIQIDTFEKAEAISFHTDKVMVYSAIPDATDFEVSPSESRVIKLETTFIIWENKINTAVS